MTDKKKGFEPPTSGAPTPAGTSSTSPTGTPAPGTRAAARRSGSTPPPKVSPEPQGFLEKYRFLLLIGIVIVGLGAVALVVSQSATAAPYTCTTLMTPGPTDPIPTPRPEPSATPVASVAPVASAAAASAAPAASVTPAPTPEPQPTQRLGFVAQDLGRDHVGDTTSITYAYCPPASGKHFASNLAPLPRRLYNPTDSLKPGNWIHNLEHGYVVLLYKGDPGKDVLAQLGTIIDQAPGTAFTTTKCGVPNKVIAVRFDNMSTPFAALSWDRALLLDTFDATQLATFAAQFQESTVWPEPGSC